MKKFSMFLTGITFILYAFAANATLVTFGDDSIYWPGWSNGTSDDSNDTIGTPDILGGTAEVNGGYLTQLTFDLKAKAYLSLWDKIGPGDLFINTNTNDYNWDFLVKTHEVKTPGNSGLYTIAQPLGDINNIGNYIMSSMPGYGYRENHPTGLDVTGSSPVGSVYFSGWPGQPGQVDELVSVTFDFDPTDILLDGNFFSIGFAITTCANDAVYEEISNPVPEPATLFLLGAGLIGLAGIGRKKLCK